MLRELALFAGIGGGLLATHHFLGWQCVGYVEMDEYRCKVLEARIRDGLLTAAPIFQMHTGDFINLGFPEKYRGVVDIITAGFPCQPFSTTGKMEAGDDERNGWPDTLRIIRKVRPRYVLLENVTGLLAISHGYFGQILKELAESGYDAEWHVLSACAEGAPHPRERLFVMAYPSEMGRCGRRWQCSDSDKGTKSRKETIRLPHPTQTKGFSEGRRERWWATEPDVGRVVNGLPHRLERVAALGDGQVPAVVAKFWEIVNQ